MLEERSTMADILAKVREIISDEPPSYALPRMASPAPELHVVKRDAPLVDGVDARHSARPRSDASEPRSPVSPDALEPVFANAFREAISPPVQRWVNTHEADLTRALSPMIQRWMDNHLPKLVESVLKEELGRAIGKTLRRST